MIGLPPESGSTRNSAHPGRAALLWCMIDKAYPVSNVQQGTLANATRTLVLAEAISFAVDPIAHYHFRARSADALCFPSAPRQRRVSHETGYLIGR
jgi:hypothetical protein